MPIVITLLLVWRKLFDTTLDSFNVEPIRNNSDITTPCARKRLSKHPKALQKGVIMSSIGARAEQDDASLQFYKQRYYEIQDKVIHELEQRWQPVY